MPEVSADQWDEFLSHCRSVHILQTAEWGELKAAFGWHVRRLIITDTAENKIGAQILFRTGPAGLKIAYLGRGPVFSYQPEDPWAALTPFWMEVDAFCREQRAIFLLFEPDIWESEQNTAADGFLSSNAGRSVRPVFRSGRLPDGFTPSLQTIQPPRTIVLDLSAGEGNLLQRMKQKTRYNIRLAEKKGVSVAASTDLDTFYNLIKLTGQRDSFAVHSLAYYQTAYELFYSSGRCELFIARYQGQPLAALMVFIHQKRAWYFYGASSDQYRELMPNYLAQWQAIRWAMEKGCDEYDLWGVPDAEPEVLEAGFQHRSDGLWGVYRFKRGFGGVLKRSAGPWDRVYQPVAYNLYRAWMRIRRQGSNYS